MIPEGKDIASLIVSKLDSPTVEGADGEEAASPDAGIEAAAEDLMAAFKANDARGMAAALRSAFQMLEAEPKDEGEA